MTISLRTMIFGALTAALALSPLLAKPATAADAWPTRPVRFIVTLGAGSGVDIGARMFADKLSQKWGQPVVVENRPGGDGMLAITTMLSAKDDHVLLVSPTSSFTAHPYFHDKLPYDQKDLIPIARISKTVVAVSVPASLGLNSLKDLEALARAKPGQLNWTTATGFTDFVFAGYLHTRRAEDGESAVQESGRRRHRSRRRRDPGLHAGLRHRAAAGRGRQGQGARRHQS